MEESVANVLNPPETAHKGPQILAYGMNKHGSDIEACPRWWIVQWATDYPGGKPYWRASCPGYTTEITMVGWLPLPFNDWFGATWAEQMVEWGKLPVAE